MKCNFYSLGHNGRLILAGPIEVWRGIPRLHDRQDKEDRQARQALWLLSKIIIIWCGTGITWWAGHGIRWWLGMKREGHLIPVIKRFLWGYFWTPKGTAYRM